MDEQTPERAGKTIDDRLRLSEEQTAVKTPDRPPRDAAPGKKWVQVKSTEQTMDAKGYMVFKDVMNWQEVDKPKPAKRLPAASAAVKSDAPDGDAPAKT